MVFSRFDSNRLTISSTRSTPAAFATSAVLPIAAMLLPRPRAVGLVAYLACAE